MRRLLGMVPAIMVVGPPALAGAAPIPTVPGPTPYIGQPARAHPVRGVPRPAQNRFMARNGRSEIHNDAWQSDTYAWGGPLGRNPATLSSLLFRECGSIAFDRRGRVVSVCFGTTGPQLFMFDPRTLATLAMFALPPRQDIPSNIFQDFTGGGYFYLDNRDRVVTATTTRHLEIIAETGSASGFQLVHDVDLSHVLTPAEKITSALPDSSGRLWFVTKTDGLVGTVDLRSGRIRKVQLGHGSLNEIENSFATGRGGAVYVATNRRLLRMQARRDGTPRIVWQVRYPNSFEHKPSQVDDGTGTTPTVMPGGYVNITDNADPMDVMVYRTASRLRRGQRRQVCRVPVFARHASATENSLIAAGRAMVVENNYGYADPSSVSSGAVTTPGFARVDLNRNGRGCHRVWVNRQLSAPSVVPKLALRSGLIFTYTKGAGTSDPWYWTAIDFRTGRAVYRQLSGAGTFFNNNYAGISIAPSGTAYLGTLGGIIALRDG